MNSSIQPIYIPNVKGRTGNNFPFGPLRLASLFQRAPFVLLNALWLDSAAKEGKNTLKKNLSFHASCYFSLYVLRLH
ncbi:hypothetical protein CLOLEP_00417 [[Clostridium] leptum DSM 753]|uniref:Uncharacterized protein n=1 Tax=[Clostridium] leptum DSM 753 TaxID=428125 RepID=A7VPE1_9FIRM|nr:hypothetical protein CLOLEP_00417 [[Clostridium] leptum DSM 753]PEQ24374.1 hypothetical protein CH238_09260 [[Clostridium] leptum DSM 753]